MTNEKMLELKINLDGPFSAEGLKAHCAIEQTASGAQWVINGPLADAISLIIDHEIERRDPKAHRMQVILACLLEHYIEEEDMDELASEAEALVPDWEDLIDEWKPQRPS